jgi:hypothetical protein
MHATFLYEKLEERHGLERRGTDWSIIRTDLKAT